MWINGVSAILFSPLIKVELLKREVGWKRFKHRDPALDWNCREFLRLGEIHILIHAEAVLPAPRDFMCGQETAQVGGVEVEPVVVAHDAGDRLCVTSRDTEAMILIVHEPVERYLAQRTQITADIRCFLQGTELLRADGEMCILRDTVHGLVERSVLPGVPIHGFAVHVGHVPETSPMSRTKKGRKRDLVKNVKDRIMTRTFRVG